MHILATTNPSEAVITLSEPIRKLTSIGIGKTIKGFPQLWQNKVNKII